tara:strand:+ start:2409 stop:2825 length:417 start_codon:yes stop_codon:yes gene_type:complete
MSEQQPNWDKITEGKVRHGFAIEAFKKGMSLDKETMDLVDKWVYFVIHGLEGLKDIVNNHKVEQPDLVEHIVKATNGEVLNGTSEGHVSGKILDAIKGLNKQNQNRVKKALKAGKITVNNLDTSLSRIQEMKQAQGNG